MGQGKSDIFILWMSFALRASFVLSDDIRLKYITISNE